MNLLLSFLLLLFSLLVGVAAIGGETWKPTSGRWYAGLTGRGWLTVLCLFLTVVVGFAKDSLSERENGELRRLLEQSRGQVAAVSQQLDATREQLEHAVSRQLDATREELKHASVEASTEVKESIAASFGELPKPLVLSPSWSLVARMSASPFSASRVVLTGFPCDIKARLTFGWDPDTLDDPDDTESFERVLQGEPKVLAATNETPELRAFAGSELLDAIPPPLWAASLKLELSSERTCAGVYWIDKASPLGGELLSKVVFEV